VLFLSAFVAGPRTNFVVADFWRWAVVHMWAEAFFEVFTTVLLAYFMVMMGFVGQAAASRIVYLATLLFLGSGLLGISHNFYWNAKPVATLAVGSVFSTLQVVPLILLTLEAWQFRRLPRQAVERAGAARGFGQQEAFLFLVGVNFWNFLGAGLFGFMINLPIVNYYEHSTYLTVNHGHAALMGVYGNLALAAIVFCSRFLLEPRAWDARLLRRVFWSINVGLALMIVVDLLPVGSAQFAHVLDHGLWSARSQAFVQGGLFQALTWARIGGGALFVLGGVLPLAWFMLSRLPYVKRRRIRGPRLGPVPAAAD
jgi:nitric oxide reductase subunit B